MHGAPADVDDEDGPVFREVQAVPECGRDGLVHESHPTEAEPPEDLLHLGPVALERGHGRSHDQFPQAMAGVALDLHEQLAQERLRRLARGHAPAPDAREREQRLARESRLERGHEGRARDAVVVLQRRAADVSLAAEKEPPRNRWPRAEAVEEPGILDQMNRRGYQAGGFERLAPRRLAADRR